MSAERHHLNIRRFKSSDVLSAKALIKTVQSEMARSECKYQLQELVTHPSFYLLCASIGYFIRFFFKSVTLLHNCLLTAVIVIAVESVHFIFFWNKISGVFSEGVDISTIQKYYSQSKRLLLIAEADDHIVGTVALTPSLTNKENGKLWRMFIHPCWRKKGVATMLINECKKEARTLGYSYIEIRTHTSNTSAMHCYLKNGFTLLGTSVFAALYPFVFCTVEMVCDLSTKDKEL